MRLCVLSSDPVPPNTEHVSSFINDDFAPPVCCAAHFHVRVGDGDLCGRMGLRVVRASG